MTASAISLPVTAPAPSVILAGRSRDRPAWAVALEAKWCAASASRDCGRLRESVTGELPGGELVTLDVLPGDRIGRDRSLARASVVYRRIDEGGRSVRGCRSACVRPLRGDGLIVCARNNRPEAGCAEVVERIASSRIDREILQEIVAQVCDRAGLWPAANLLGEAASLALAARDEASLALASTDYLPAVYRGPICQLRGEAAVAVHAPGPSGEVVVARFCRVDLARIYLGWHTYDAGDLEIAS